MSTVAVVLAGGSGTRLQHPENKVYLELGGRSLLAWSLLAFQRSQQVEGILLVVRAGDEPQAAAVTGPSGLTKLIGTVAGGATRHDSERAALEALAPDVLADRIGVIAIHDAARPFVREPLLERLVTCAREVGGAVPALQLDGGFLLRVGADGTPSPVPTDDLRRVQTPQVFRARELLLAYRRAEDAAFHGVDTAATVERFTDLTVGTVEGDPDNIKVTFVDDLPVAEELARGWDVSRSPA